MPQSSVKNTPQEQLLKTAKQIRVSALRAINKANSGHPGGSLSLADILTVLYFDLLKHDPQNPAWPERDLVVISKGHASPAIYATLAAAGYFSEEEFIQTFRQINSKFQGHIDHLKVPGIEASTGSLGHGLSLANGMALGARLDKTDRKIYALLSDGELQEGQCWEAFMAAAHYKLGNLTAIIDRNRIQLDGWTETTMALEPLDQKLQAFGWQVETIDGHDFTQIKQAIQKGWERKLQDKPLVIIANTLKGKGVSFMEDQVKWHGVAPKQEDLDKALAELA